MHDLSIGSRGAVRKQIVVNVEGPILTDYGPQYLEVIDGACLSSTRAISLAMAKPLKRGPINFARQMY